MLLRERLLESVVEHLRPGGKESGSAVGLAAVSAGGLRVLDLGSGDGRVVIRAVFLSPTLAEAVGVKLSRHELPEKNHIARDIAQHRPIRAWGHFTVVGGERGRCKHIFADVALPREVRV